MVDRGVVFVGPSLGTDRPTIPEVEYRPPARRGDVLLAALEGVPAIGLIDGVFHQDLAVTPRELRAASALGALLIGGSSMGALRAVDCPDAMIGVGAIYQAFARGDLQDDDEVAVTFTPDSYQLYSYALVQIRAAGDHARFQGVSAKLVDAWIAAVRSLHFRERTLDVIVSTAAGIAPALAASVEAALITPNLDPKRADALAVIETLRTRLADHRFLAAQ